MIIRVSHYEKEKVQMPDGTLADVVVEKSEERLSVFEAYKRKRELKKLGHERVEVTLEKED